METDASSRRSTGAASSLSAQLEAVLQAAAEAGGARAAPVSLNVEYVAAEREVAGSHAAVSRATRSLIFATASLTAADGSVVAAGDAVFRVVRPDT